MADVFVSYSRRDQEFVGRLARALEDRGREVWVDVSGIDDAAVFPAAIRAAIEGCDSFVFVITPESAASAYCVQEVDYARELGKRIVPLLVRPVPDEALPPDIRDRNWIPFDDPGTFEPSIERLIAACDRDQAHVHEHTRILVRALEWDAKGQDPSFLLRGSDLTAVEDWLDRSGAATEPQPLPLQRAFARQSRRAAARRGRILAGASLGVAVLAVGLVIFALISRSDAVTARTTARAQALAADAQVHQESDPQISLALAQRAVRLDPLPQALYALRGALDASSLLATYTVPAGLVDRCNRANPGSGSSPLVAVFRPRSRTIVTLQCDGTAVLRDADTGRITRRVTLPFHANISVGFSHDSRELALGSEDRVDVLNAASFRILRTFATAGWARSLHFSDGDRQLAYVLHDRFQAELGTVWRVDLRTGAQAELVHTPVASSVAFARGGGQLFVGTSGRQSVEVLAAGSGRVLRRLTTGAYSGEYGATGVTVSPDGNYLAATLLNTTDTGVAQLWNLHTGRRVRVVESVPEQPVEDVAFSPDSSRLALGNADGTGGVWTVFSNARLTSFGGQTNTITDLSFAADGGRVLTSDASGTIRLWRARGPELVDAQVGTPATGFYAIDQGQSTLIGVSGRGHAGLAVSRWSVPSGRLLGVQPLRDVLPRFDTTVPNDYPDLSPDGTVVLVADSSRHLELRAVHGRPVGTLPAVVYQSDAISPDDRTVVLYGGQKTADAPHLAGVLAVAGRDATIPLQTPASERQEWDGYVATVGFSDDGREVVGAFEDGAIEVWSAATGRLLHTVHVPNPSDADVADDGRELIVGAEDDETTLWDLRTGALRHTLLGDTGPIKSVVLTPDGRYAITTSLDDTARVWDTASGDELRRYPLPVTPSTVTVAPDGSSFAVAGASGFTQVFDTCTACQSARKLLSLAAARGQPRLTAAEQAAVAGA